MHIISGILLSALFGLKDKSGKKGVKGFSGIISVAHQMPGRMRLTIPSLRTTSVDIVATLQKIDAIHKVEKNLISASLIITYDEHQLEDEILFGAVIQIMGLEGEIDKPVRPAAIHHIQQIIDSLNRGIYEYTGGHLDLYHSVPLILIGLGAYQFIKTRKLLLPGALTLMWWGFSSLLGRGNHDK
ncbi:HMA2 domain-containing protein [Salinispira pacifica]|uniref:Uncharacterized protein n=1 Tax=Salinispira pacifica TaxID=1307761 RepID=V5WE85_9SPIO|nr:hypothetical protein [Salinispira pacifica]AHC14102.1 hypothetical protein L21SP2_0675 [Salinispira pacifica]